MYVVWYFDDVGLFCLSVWLLSFFVLFLGFKLFDFIVFIIVTICGSKFMLIM